jgi:creatinine amidohydrolase
MDEMARNGCRKIIILNGHGANNALLQYFLKIQLNTERPYVLYVDNALGPRPGASLPAAAAPSAPGVDGHAGEEEIAGVMANRSEAAHPERTGEESSANQGRLYLPEGLSTPIG